MSALEALERCCGHRSFAASHRTCSCQPLGEISFLLHLLDLLRFGADSSLSFYGKADFRLSKNVGDVARVLPASLLAGALRSQQPRLRPWCIAHNVPWPSAFAEQTSSLCRQGPDIRLKRPTCGRLVTSNSLTVEPLVGTKSKPTTANAMTVRGVSCANELAGNLSPSCNAAVNMRYSLSCTDLREQLLGV